MHSSYVVVVLYTTADVAFQGVGFIDIYFCKFLYNSPDKFSRNPWPVVAGGGRLKRNLIYRNEKKIKYIYLHLEFCHSVLVSNPVLVWPGLRVLALTCHYLSSLWPKSNLLASRRTFFIFWSPNPSECKLSDVRSLL